MDDPALELARVPRRPPRIDLVIAGALLIWAEIEAIFGEGPGALWVRVLVGIGFTVPLVWRRQAPLAAMAVIAAVLVAHAVPADTPEQGAMPFPSLLVATFSVALYVRSAVLAVAGGLVPIALMIVAAATDYFGVEPGPTDFAIMGFFVAGAWVAGRLVQRRALQLEAARAESGELAREAVMAERARIARELHDIVAHAVSIIAMQAGAAEGLVERSPDEAKAHMETVRNTARQALNEMRRMLDVLRDDDAPYAPQPTLDRLPQLIEDARASGLPVELVEAGDRGRVPPGVDLATYRIVQEALTNVRKHAGPVPTTVRVEAHPTRIDVEVVNGPGSNGHGSAGGAGRGLLGMRERVRVYGGRVDAGPEPGGGFGVRATLPLEDDA